jgi:hypothetical protein
MLLQSKPSFICKTALVALGGRPAQFLQNLSQRVSRSFRWVAVNMWTVRRNQSIHFQYFFSTFFGTFLRLSTFSVLSQYFLGFFSLLSQYFLSTFSVLLSTFSKNHLTHLTTHEMFSGQPFATLRCFFWYWC